MDGAKKETYRSDDGLHPVPHSDIERTYYGLDSKALPPSPRHLMAPPEKERYHKYNEADGLEHHPDPRRRRQGTRPVVIWLSAAIVFLIIVAAVVGGVLGSKASSASNIDPTKEFQSSSPSNPSSSPTSSASTSTTAVRAGPVASISSQPPSTRYRDCPDSNATTYSVLADSMEFRYLKLCNTSFQDPTNRENSPSNVISAQAVSLDVCLGMCGAINWNNPKTNSTSGKKCQAVCWRDNRQSGSPPWCYGFTLSNTTDGNYEVGFEDGKLGRYNVGLNDKLCDGAILVNP